MNILKALLLIDTINLFMLGKFKSLKLYKAHYQVDFTIY